MNPRGKNVIGPYIHRAAQLQPYDSLYPEVAGYVAGLIKAKLNGVTVEHIGSTAIEGCDGKGNIDLMVLYPDGFLQQTKDALLFLGFQPQPHRDPFPEDRPMRVGSVTYRRRLFQIHVHMIQQGAAEAHSLMKFRDTLREDSRLRERYVEC